jgi:hypothetical protein
MGRFSFFLYILDLSLQINTQHVRGTTHFCRCSTGNLHSLVIELLSLLLIFNNFLSEILKLKVLRVQSFTPSVIGVWDTRSGKVHGR